jgi:hypothetical protein
MMEGTEEMTTEKIGRASQKKEKRFSSKNGGEILLKRMEEKFF